MAASIRGQLSDPSGRAVSGTTVVLLFDGKVVGSGVSRADGSFQILTGRVGRFYLLVAAPGYRQLETPVFYAGRSEEIERDLVIEPWWVERPFVNGAGLAQTEPMSGLAATLYLESDFKGERELGTLLGSGAGVSADAQGQRGASVGLRVRGGSVTATKLLVNGVEATAPGEGADLARVSSLALERVELDRGPQTAVDGLGGEAGTIRLTTANGTTSFPSWLFSADAGTLSSSHELAQVAGTHNRLDYLAAYDWSQSANDLPGNEFHRGLTEANLGWQWNGSTEFRATLEHNVSAVGDPGAWDFHRMSDDRRQGRQDTIVSLGLEVGRPEALHHRLSYGALRQHGQNAQWTVTGDCYPASSCDGAAASYAGGNYYGKTVTIVGANGARASGRALMNLSAANGGVYPNRLTSSAERDQIGYQGEWRARSNLTLVAAYRYANERAAANEPAYAVAARQQNRHDESRVGLIGSAAAQRLFYSARAAFERDQPTGNALAPQLATSYYAVRPRPGFWSGTRLTASFAKGRREPSLAESAGSLHVILVAEGQTSTIASLGLRPLVAPTSRSWEGGLEQSLRGEKTIVRATWFHTGFADQMETIDPTLVSTLMPGLDATAQAELVARLRGNSLFSLTTNAQGWRAEGIESSVVNSFGHGLRLSGSYTWTHAVVEHSLLSDHSALAAAIPTVNGVAIGAAAPLRGARPFRLPAESGSLTASWSRRRMTTYFRSGFAGQSDDSDYLAGEDTTGGNSLLLPNRNLDHGYARMDWGMSVQLRSGIRLYGVAENLANSQHMAPLGSPSTPLTVRSGLRLELGQLHR